MMAAIQHETGSSRPRSTRVALLGENTFHESGIGPSFPLSEREGRLQVVGIEITRCIDGQSLIVSIWGSNDGLEWQSLMRLPKKYYCGSYTATLDLGNHPDVRYLRAEWEVNRWIRDDRKPLFTFEVSLL